MENVNWFAVGLVVCAGVALIIYLIVRNRKDEKEYEKSENTIVEDDNDADQPGNGL